MHLSSICVLLVGLVLLIQLSVGAGQMMDPTPDPMNSCLFRGELFETDPIFPVKIFPSPDCIEVYCKETELGNSVDFVIVRGEDGCCELDGRLVPSGYTRDMGNCYQHECTSAGLRVEKLPPRTSPHCPPGSVSVVLASKCLSCSIQKGCITVFPLTTNFTAAIAYCSEIDGVLARPFGTAGLTNQRLLNVIGQVNGWLGARGPGESDQPWPSDRSVNFMPSSFWYSDTPIFLRNASGCMGYRFDNSSGGLHQYSCSDQLQPICDVTPQETCSHARCPTDRSGTQAMQHGEIRPTSTVCLNKKCWFGQRTLVKDPTCCTLEEPAGNTTAISLHQEGTFDTALQTCTCQEAELTCSDRLVSNCPGSVNPP